MLLACILSCLFRVFSVLLFFCFFRFSFNALRYLNNQCMSIQCVCTFKLPCILETKEQIFLSLSSLSLLAPLPFSLPCRMYLCMRSIIRCTQFLSHLSGQFLYDLLSFWLFNSFEWLSMAVFCALYLFFSSLIFASLCFQRCVFFCKSSVRFPSESSWFTTSPLNQKMLKQIVIKHTKEFNPVNFSSSFFRKSQTHTRRRKTSYFPLLLLFHSIHM